MKPVQKAGVAAIAVGSTLLGGALGAVLVNGSANAQTTDTTATDTTATTPTTTDSSGGNTQTPQSPPPEQGHDPSEGGHMANGITEELLTGDTADKVSAAALAAVPGGTIERVETDAEGSPYEAHVTKSDGSHVTVKVDDSFTVTGVEAGHR